MRKIVWSIIVAILPLFAGVTDQQIAHMFVLGFEGQRVPANVREGICDYELGGVILFGKNIRSKEQVRSLTRGLNGCHYKPLIAVDQEGGKVRRIRFDNKNYPRASYVARSGVKQARRYYDAMAAELASLGINYNLAPVADLAVNPKNYIISKLGRSYGVKPKKVILYNTIFIKAMHARGVLTSLKHFPGHGSSRGDTHQGFVDVSKTWSSDELKPFGNRLADSIMVAHVVCDPVTEPGIPASLSPHAIRTLRKHNRRVVAITDDLQMGAIRKHYGLRETIYKAIKAGEDLLLFGNQLSRKNKVNIRQLVGIVKSLIQHDKSLEKAIKRANARITNMRRRLKKIHVSPRIKHGISVEKQKKLETFNNGKDF